MRRVIAAGSAVAAGIQDSHLAAVGGRLASAAYLKLGGGVWEAIFVQLGVQYPTFTAHLAAIIPKRQESRFLQTGWAPAACNRFQRTYLYALYRLT